MKYKDFPKCGIHTRLRVIIDNSGGYDEQKAALALSKEFNIGSRQLAINLAIKGPEIWDTLHNSLEQERINIYDKVMDERNNMVASFARFSAMCAAFKSELKWW